MYNTALMLPKNLGYYKLLINLFSIKWVTLNRLIYTAIYYWIFIKYNGSCTINLQVTAKVTVNYLALKMLSLKCCY